MFDFLKKSTPQKAQPQPDIERLTVQLTSAIKAQMAAGNITANDLMKFIHLVYDGSRLRAALNYL